MKKGINKLGHPTKDYTTDHIRQMLYDRFLLYNADRLYSIYLYERVQRKEIIKRTIQGQDIRLKMRTYLKQASLGYEVNKQ